MDDLETALLLQWSAGHIYGSLNLVMDHIRRQGTKATAIGGQLLTPLSCRLQLLRYNLRLHITRPHNRVVCTWTAAWAWVQPFVWSPSVYGVYGCDFDLRWISSSRDLGFVNHARLRKRSHMIRSLNDGWQVQRPRQYASFSPVRYRKPNFCQIQSRKPATYFEKTVASWKSRHPFERAQLSTYLYALTETVLDMVYSSPKIEGEQFSALEFLGFEFIYRQEIQVQTVRMHKQKRITPQNGKDFGNLPVKFPIYIGNIPYQTSESLYSMKITSFWRTVISKENQSRSSSCTSRTSSCRLRPLFVP